MYKRRYQSSQNREQPMLLPARIEDYVGEDNTVRVIDAYVETLDLGEMGFTHTKFKITAGQPPYDPAVMLKIYLYGYCNKIRSSRNLQTETRRNMEMVWLTQNSRPSHTSIASFRRNNLGALGDVNRDFVLLCKELGLFGGRQVAVDGTFMKANAAKSTIRTKGYLDREIEGIEKKIAEYHRELERNDAEEEEDTDTCGESDLEEKIEKMKRIQEEKREVRKELERSGNTQVSSVDEDARLMTKRGTTLPAYNAQIAVDDKHNLVVAEAVVRDGNDAQQLVPMTVKAMEALGVEEIEVLADKGYCAGEQIKECEERKITAYVPVPRRNGGKKGIGKEEFAYDSEEDCYVCPEGKRLVAGKNLVRRNGRNCYRYSARAGDCSGCPLRDRCLGKREKVRSVYRWEHEEVVERHAARMKRSECREKMKKRGAMVEHPFGTIKCRNGYYQFLMRGLEKCRGEFSFMVLAYNFTRVLKIVGKSGFMEYCAQRMEKMKEKGIKRGETGVNSSFYRNNAPGFAQNCCLVLQRLFSPG